MGTCKAYRCATETDEVLCREHAKRLRSGGGLPTAAETFPGDPSGHGIFGHLEQTEFGAICHECGHPVISVALHAYRTHGLSAADYRRRHGIPRNIPLVADQVTANRASDTPRALRRRLPCRRCGATYTVKGRLCDTCKQNPPPQAPKRPRRRALTPDEETALREAFGTDDLNALIRDLQNAGALSRDITRALGRSNSWISRHHPRANRKPRRPRSSSETSEASPGSDADVA